MQLYPLTSGQKSILLFQEIHSDSSLFNIGGYAILNGEINLPVFLSSFDVLVKSHSIFRLKLKLDGETTKQYIDETAKGEINYLNFSNEVNPEKSCFDWMNLNIKKKIGFNKGILYESALLKQSDNKFYWYLKLHHLVVDGFSIALIFNNICKEYSERIKQPLTTESFNTSNFIFYVEEEERYRKSDEYRLDLKFWLDKMQNVPRHIKFDSEVENSSLISERVQTILSRDDFRIIQEYCVKINVSVFHYFITVLYIFYSNIFLVKDMVIGIPVLNRSDYKAKKSVGPHFNVIPFHMKYDKTLSILEIIKGVKLDILNSFKHVRFPILDTIQGLNHAGNLYNTTFSYQKTSYDSRFGENDAEIVFMKSNEQMNDLDVHILDFNDNLDLKMIFDFKIDFLTSEDALLLLNKFSMLLTTAFKCDNNKVYEMNVLKDVKESDVNEFGGFSF